VNQIEDHIGKLLKMREERLKNLEDNNGLKMMKIGDKELFKS